MTQIGENDLNKITHIHPDKAFCKISPDQLFKVYP